MIRYEVWCYRCRQREGAEEPNEASARERIADFRRDHMASCGAGCSFGSSIYETQSLTGDAYPRSPGVPS